MPVEIRTRAALGGRLPLQASSIGVLASFFVQVPNEKGLEPIVFERALAAQERDGFDAVLIPQRSFTADVWSLASWAVARTKSLGIIASHRPGVQSPTHAARALATIDVLSGGRIQVHFIQSASEGDIAGDGDFLSKVEGYRRSAEYVSLFEQELKSVEQFDYEGEFYRVRGARSSVHPVQKPRPVFQAAGSSPEGFAFAMAHADLWAYRALGLEQIGAELERARQVARGLGRTIAGWAGGYNVILAETDEAAWDLARETADFVANYIRLRQQEDPSFRPFSYGDAKAFELAADSREEGQFRPERSLYTRLSALTGHGPSLVGTPDSVADYLTDHYRLGVSAITLGGLSELYGKEGEELLDPPTQELRRALVRTLRERTTQVDVEAARNPALVDHPRAIAEANA